MVRKVVVFGLLAVLLATTCSVQARNTLFQRDDAGMIPHRRILQQNQNTVADFFSNVVNSVNDFFSNLFGATRPAAPAPAQEATPAPAPEATLAPLPDLTLAPVVEQSMPAASTSAVPVEPVPAPVEEATGPAPVEAVAAAPEEEKSMDLSGIDWETYDNGETLITFQ